MEEDCSFVAPGHLPSRRHRPQGYLQNQGSFHPSQPNQRNTQNYQYNNSQIYQNNAMAYQGNAQTFQTYQKNTWVNHGNAQGYPSPAQSYHHTQAYQNQAQAYQAPKTYSCGPCNRTFHSQYQHEKHLQEHVKCPFPECNLSAHPKVIERHIDNQHLLVNFANLQIDDEAWIAERKRRFPTSKRAELRRAEQLEKAKRGEKLGKSTKPFAPRSVRGRGRGRGRGKGGGGIGGGGGGGEDDGAGVKNDKRKWCDSESSNQRGRKMRRVQDCRKEKVEGENEGEKTLIPTPSHSMKEAPPRQRNARAAIIVMPDPDSEDDSSRDGIPAFRGTRHFYESTGEVSYFGTKSGTATGCHMKEEDMKEKERVDIDHISDEEEWDENESREASVGAPTAMSTTLALGGALGSLMGAYSDSEEDNDTKDSAPEVVKQSSTQGQTQNITKGNPSSVNQPAEHGKIKNTYNGRKGSALACTTTTTPAGQTRHRRRKRHPKNGMRRIPKNPRGARNCFPKRRKTLLERLLLPDITRERNIILQCVRFIVQHNFFPTPQSMEEGKEKEEESSQEDEQKGGTQKKEVEEEKVSHGGEEGHGNDVVMEIQNHREKEVDGEGKETKTDEENQKQKDESVKNEGDAGVNGVMCKERN